MWWLLTACGAPDLTPAWAWDPIWLEGAGPTGAHGFQTWQLYGPGWADDRGEEHFVCAVVVELRGELLDGCDAAACEVGWSIEPSFLETDCPDPTLAEDPLFTSLQALALGAPYAGEDAPHVGLTTSSWADYGSGWDAHGYAYPEAFDVGGSADPSWSGEDPFLFTPSAAFPVP